MMRFFFVKNHPAVKTYIDKKQFHFKYIKYAKTAFDDVLYFYNFIALLPYRNKTIFKAFYA